jgi:Zn-dependent protease with chaperone function
LGGTKINLSTSDPKERQLLNVVEEMAIASGVPVPSIYVLDSEKGINTFSAGHDIGDAAIGVTRGCLHVLNRDELQAMVAHEFSHVLNGDIRLNVRLIGVLFGIMMIGSTGRWIFEKGIFVGAASRGRRGSINGVPIMIAGGGLIRTLHGTIDPARDHAPARVPRRRICRAVHAKPRRARWRAEEDWRLCERGEGLRKGDR